MAGNVVRRFVQAIFDAVAAKKVEQQFESSLGTAGKKGGQSFVRELRAAFDKRMADLKVSLANGLIDPKQFKIQADLAAKQFNTGLISGMEKARKAGTLTDSEYLKLSRTLKKVGDEGTVAGGKIGGAFIRAGASLAAFFSIQKAVAFIRQSITAAIESEQSVARLDVALESLGLRYSQVAPEVEKYLDNLQKTTRFSDEDGREALSRLITITGDYRTALRLMDVTANIAEKRNISMAEAAQTAGNASRGLTKGMKDLGISTKDTGDIVAKIQRNIGNLATETGASSRTIAIANNLWGEFKEKIGQAIIGSNGLQGSSRGLIKALTDLNTWAEKNSGAISKFVDKLVGAAAAIAKISEFIIKHTPNIYTLGKAWDWVTGKTEEATFAGVTGQASTTAAVKKGGKDRKELTEEEIEAIKRRQKELADEVVRTQTEIAVRRLQIAQGLTEALAREEIRRRDLLAGKPKPEAATEGDVAAAHAELDRVMTIAKAAEGVLDTNLGPAVKRTETRFMNLSLAMSKIPAAKPAGAFASSWTKALRSIEDQVNSDMGLFHELGQAWAEGGFAGLAALAAHKVKENLASAIEMAARAFGSFAFGNPASAGLYLKSAAEHGLAAAAWSTIAGGGGGASSASSASGVGGGGGANLSRGESMPKPEAEIHVYFRGPKVFSPEMEKFVVGNLQTGQERQGKSAHVRIHREG